MEEEYNTNIGDAKEPNIKQDVHVVERICTNMDADLKINNNANGYSYTNVNTLTNYFLSLPNIMADKRKNSELTQRVHNIFNNVFNAIGCFQGTFSLQLKPNSKPYQAPPRHATYVLQRPFKKELDWLQKWT